jgi:hypothetical protein
MNAVGIRLKPAAAIVRQYGEQLRAPPPRLAMATVGEAPSPALIRLPTWRFSRLGFQWGAGRQRAVWRLRRRLSLISNFLGRGAGDQPRAEPAEQPLACRVAGRAIPGDAGRQHGSASGSPFAAVIPAALF